MLLLKSSFWPNRCCTTTPKPVYLIQMQAGFSKQAIFITKCLLQSFPPHISEVLGKLVRGLSSFQIKSSALEMNQVWQQSNFYKLERQKNVCGLSSGPLLHGLAEEMLDNSSYCCPPIGSINGASNVAICLSSVHSACWIKDYVERWASFDLDFLDLELKLNIHLNYSPKHTRKLGLWL